MNVLKKHLQTTVFTLFDRHLSQRAIAKLTGVDRKTIRRYRGQWALVQANSPGEVTAGFLAVEPNSPREVTAGFEGVGGQTPPPRPPAFEGLKCGVAEEAGAAGVMGVAVVARSACEPHRVWIEEQVRLKRNGQAIYQDLVDCYGFGCQIACNCDPLFASNSDPLKVSA